MGVSSRESKQPLPTPPLKGRGAENKAPPLQGRGWGGVIDTTSLLGPALEGRLRLLRGRRRAAGGDLLQQGAGVLAARQFQLLHRPRQPHPVLRRRVVGDFGQQV